MVGIIQVFTLRRVSCPRRSLHSPKVIWKLNKDGSVSYDRFDYHRRAVDSENEAFYLRIQNVGDFRYEGADLGILITRGRAMDDKFKLTKRAKSWINGIKSQYKAKPLPAVHALASSEPALKIL